MKRMLIAKLLLLAATSIVPTDWDWSAAVARARLHIVLATRDRETDEDSDVCPACNGEGEVGDGRIMTPCKRCDGTGRISRDTHSESIVSPLKGPDQEALRLSVDAADVIHQRLGQRKRNEGKTPDSLALAHPDMMFIAQMDSTAPTQTKPRFDVRLIMVSLGSCVPCERQKLLLPRLKELPIDVVSLPEALAAGFAAPSSFPCWIVVDHQGRELKRFSGVLSIQQLRTLASTQVVNTARTTNAIVQFRDDLPEQLISELHRVTGTRRPADLSIDLSKKISRSGVVFLAHLLRGELLIAEGIAITSTQPIWPTPPEKTPTGYRFSFRVRPTVVADKWLLKLRADIAGIDVDPELTRANVRLVGWPDLVLRLR